MLIRICLILAIVAGLATAGIGFVQLQERIVQHMKDRDAEKAAKEKEMAEHNKTKKNLKDTADKLTVSEKNLTDMTTLRDRLQAETERLTANLTAVTKQKTDLDAKLTEASQKLELWRQVGLQPDEVKGVIAALEKTKKDKEALIAESKILGDKIKGLNDRINILLNNTDTPELPRGLTGRIVAVDPKYNFVVLDIGTEKGVLTRGEMLVSRNGKLIGKVKIASVEPTRSIGNLLPEWQAGEVLEGDVVLR
jgi:myosin heavy subunit